MFPRTCRDASLHEKWPASPRPSFLVRRAQVFLARRCSSRIHPKQDYHHRTAKGNTRPPSTNTRRYQHMIYEAKKSTAREFPQKKTASLPNVSVDGSVFQGSGCSLSHDFAGYQAVPSGIKVRTYSRPTPTPTALNPNPDHDPYPKRVKTGRRRRCAAFVSVDNFPNCGPRLQSADNDSPLPWPTIRGEF